MRKQILTLILAAFCGMSSAFAYDFSAVCPTGQTLYYNITDAVNHEVELTCPNQNSWDGYTEPIGTIVLPTTVNYNGEDYSVTVIGNNAFIECNDLIGNLIIPDLVVTIGDFAFFSCEGFNGELVICNSVSAIGQNAFFNCNFTGDLIIPNSVTAIGDSAFESCMEFDGVLVIGNSVESIGMASFANCNKLTGDLIIPNSVTSIGVAAFNACWGFTGELKLSNSVTFIGSEAFFDCENFIGDLVIPNSLTAIESKTFLACGFTGYLTIPSSVTAIGESAFSGCSELTTITIYCDVPPVTGFDAFRSINNAIPVYVPCGSKQDYTQTEEWNQFTNYRQMPYYEFTTESGNENGRVVILQEPDCETEGIVEAIPDEGFDFLGWSTFDGEFISIENPYSFTLTEDLHLLAYFGWNDGIDDNELMKISVYPNPTSGMFIVESEDIEKIEVYNAMGQLIFTKTAYDGHTEIDLGNAADGMFLVRVTGKDWTVERNVMKR